MNNFVFENSTKVYLGEGCVKEYLSNILSSYGDTVMLSTAAVQSRKTVFMMKLYLY